MITHFPAFVCLFLPLCAITAIPTEVQFTIKEDDITTLQLPDGNSTITHFVNLTDKDVHLLYIEIHSQIVEITLSSTTAFSHGTTAIGQDIGVLTKGPLTSTNVTWYVKSEGSSTVLLHLKYLKISDPIPGGCNQVLNLENDPNLLLSYTEYFSSVRFQWSNTDEHSECENSLSQKQLQYDVYVHFVKEGELGEEYYLDAMKKMIGVDNIVKHGRKIMSLNNDMRSKSNFTLSSSNGQGAIYGVVVKNSQVGTVSSYVSIASYGCSIANQTCEVEVVAVEYVIGTMCGLVGILLCFFGHRFLKTEFFIFGFLKVTILTFLLLSIFTSASSVTVFAISWIVGIFGGALCVLLWWYWGIPIFSVLLVGLGGGFLFAAVVFFSPFGNFDIWEADLNYWMAFVSAQLIYVLSLLCFTKTLNIITSAFVGSYLICIFIDYLLHTSLKLILLNTFNHAIVDGFVKIKNVFPFQLNDIIVVGVWAALLIFGAIVQFNQAKGHAPFPPCPRTQRKRRLEQARNRRRAMEQYDNERQPLIFERPHSYQAYQRQELYEPT